MIFEFDFLDKVVQRAKILDINADESLNTRRWFVVNKELILDVLIEKVDKIDTCREFRVKILGEEDLLVGGVDGLWVAAGYVAH